MSVKSYLEKSSAKQHASHYYVRYLSPLTGTVRRLSQKITGPLPTSEAATAWIGENLARIIKNEIELKERQAWRDHATIVKRTNEYKAFKLKQAPRSAQQELSILFNFVLPYYVVDQQLIEPKEWYKKHKRFKAWLLADAKTAEGENIAVSTAGKAINSLNKFSEWLVEHDYLASDDYHPLKAFPAKMLARKGVDDLIDEEEFELIYNELRRDPNTLWADMFKVQSETGMRANEVVGLMFPAVSAKKTDDITAAFTEARMQVYGTILLDSQPAQAHIKRINNEIPRAPLKWRPEISFACSRTIPVVDKEAWNILARRFQAQKELFLKKEYGHKKENYLIFDGAQRLKYMNKISDAYKAIGLTPKGSHSLRHTRSTEWVRL